MNPLLDALKKAGVATPEPTALPVTAVRPALPDPLSSPWIALLRQHVEIPKDPSIGQLTSRSDTHAKVLKTAGRTREAQALTQLKDQFLRERDKRAWEQIKLRFDALDLNEKAYRALKQEGADPIKVLAKLTSRKSEELRGLGAARIRDALLG